MNELTDDERRFAEQHHHIVYRYLRLRHLSIPEYYDIVIFRYMGAVRRYLSEPELRKYAFSTIAYGAMRSALYNHFRAEKRRLERCVTSTELIETVVGIDPDDNRNDVSKILWMEVASLLTQPELELVKQRAAGFTYREIAENSGLKEGTVFNRMSKLRKRICGLCDIDAMIARIIGQKG